MHLRTRGIEERALALVGSHAECAGCCSGSLLRQTNNGVLYSVVNPQAAYKGLLASQGPVGW